MRGEGGGVGGVEPGGEGRVVVRAGGQAAGSRGRVGDGDDGEEVIGQVKGTGCIDDVKLLEEHRDGGERGGDGEDERWLDGGQVGVG